MRASTPMVVRGRVVEADLVEFGGRGGGIRFAAPDPHRHAAALPLPDPLGLADLYRLRFDDILDSLEALGQALELERNPWLQEALEASFVTSSLTPPLLRQGYRSLRHLFGRGFAAEMAESTVGIAALDGWVPRTLLDGRRVSVRAFGARAVHIIAGNSPIIAALSILRNALTRGDAIIKTPSNDPFTAQAIARTMIGLDAAHPLTRHLSVASWKGGDAAIEASLYRPAHVEQIVAWGGLAAVRHVTRYIQPGLELIALDPKRSMSILGPEALLDEAASAEAALRLATDIGAMNQEGCVNARVAYVLCGSDAAGLARLIRFGQQVYEALVRLPACVSTPPRQLDPELRSMLEAARLNEEWYRVIGGEDGEGAIIVSQLAEPVAFAPLLAGRVANLVAVDAPEQIFKAVDAYTQTVGIYPERLKLELRDRLALHGAQRLTSLGYAAAAAVAGPQDGIEPMRQMCRWIVCEDCQPAVTQPLWTDGAMFRPTAAASPGAAA